MAKQVRVYHPPQPPDWLIKIGEKYYRRLQPVPWSWKLNKKELEQYKNVK